MKNIFKQKSSHVRMLLTAGIIALFSGSPGFGLNIPDSVAAAKERLDSLQKAYVGQKYGMFIHFNMSTFTKMSATSPRGEWGDPTSHPDLFNPSRLDCGQWADAAVASKMKYMVLVAKHHDGFCLWPSEHSTHTVKESKWRDGKGDVVREFVDSARSRGIAVGLYYSIYDGYKLDGKNIVCYRKGCDSNFVKNQLTELLTNYGPISCLWFDRWGWRWESAVSYNTLSYKMIHDHIKSIQPNCMVIDNNHLSDKITSGTIKSSDIRTLEAQGGVPAKNTVPTELAISVRQVRGSDHCWFYKPKNNCKIITAQKVVDILEQANANVGTLLLNVTVDTSGTLPQCQYDTLTKVGNLLPEDYQPPYEPLSGVVAPVVSSGRIDGISIFRSPGSISIQIDGQQRLSVSLLDIRGRVVRRVTSAAGRIVVPTVGLGAGTYLLNLSTGVANTVRPLVLSR